MAMHLLPIIALLETADISILDEMLRLIGIAAILFVLFKGIKSLITKPAAPAAPVAPASSLTATPAALDSSLTAAPGVSHSPAPAEVITSEVLAVIAAAVATVSDSSRRIVSIKSYNTQWEKAGRLSNLTSHRIR
jgi:hypothetical protein